MEEEQQQSLRFEESTDALRLDDDEAVVALHSPGTAGRSGAAGSSSTRRDGGGVSDDGSTGGGASGSGSGAANLVEAARRDVIDTTLGDMEELCHDIEGSTVYSIRADVLKAWAFKLRTMLRTLRDSGMQGLARGGRKGSTAVLRGATMIAGGTMRRRGSVGGMAASPPSDERTREAAPRAGGGLAGGNGGDGRGSGARAGSMALGESSVMGSGVVASVGQHASGALYLLLEALCQTVGAEWGTAFVYVAKTEELVLVASAGKKKLRPGAVRLSAGVGVEGHVLNSGVAVNVAHAYAEEEFSDEQDKQTATRTKALVVFPLTKPNNNSAIVGVVQVGNKIGDITFSPDDESRVAECAQFLSHVICTYPGDITNSHAFDPQVLVGREVEKLPPLADAPTIRAGTKIFRTKKLGHLRRQEVLRDAVAFPRAATITNALEHVSQVNDSWRNAVMLNIELEAEIRRLHEALRVSRREITRLQDVVQDLRRQLENADLPQALRTK